METGDSSSHVLCSGWCFLATPKCRKGRYNGKQKRSYSPLLSSSLFHQEPSPMTERAVQDHSLPIQLLCDLDIHCFYP